MNLEKRLLFKMARQKFGRVSVEKTNKQRKNAEKHFSCSLSILHDSFRNEAWCKKLKDIIQLTDGEIDWCKG